MATILTDLHVAHSYKRTNIYIILLLLHKNIHELYCVIIGRERLLIDRLRGVSSQLLLPEVLFVSIRGHLMISKYTVLFITHVIITRFA